MRVHRRIAVMVAMTMGLQSSAFAAPDSSSVAVVPLLAVNLRPEAVDELTTHLASALAAGRAALVRGGRAVRDRLPASGVAPDCPVSPACLADVRARLGADTLVLVVITRVADAVEIDPTIAGLDAPRPARAVRGTWTQMIDHEWLAKRVAGWPLWSSVPAPQVAVAPPHGGPRWPTWALAGLSVASLGIGIGFGVAAQNEANNLEDQGCLERSCPREDIDPVSLKSSVADAMYVTSGVAAAAALVSYFLFDRDPPPIAVQAGPRSVGIRAEF